MALPAPHYLHPTTRTLLTEIAETLLGYAHNHIAKDPPQPEKAQVNLDLARKIAHHLDPTVCGPVSVAGSEPCKEPN